MADKRPIRLRRADLNSLRENATAKLLATDVAAAWKEKSKTDEPAYIVVLPFENHVGSHANTATQSLRAWVETRMVNDSGGYVLDGQGAQENLETIRITDSAAKADAARVEFERKMKLAYAVQGTLSALNKDPDHTTYTLTLKVVKSGHEVATIEAGETVSRQP